MIGYYVSSQKWPGEDAHKLDFIIAFIVGCIVVWALTPRIGLAGNTLYKQYTLGDPGQLPSCLLGIGLAMFIGMSSHFALPHMKGLLIDISAQLVSRVRNIISAALTGKATSTEAEGSPLPRGSMETQRQQPIAAAIRRRRDNQKMPPDNG
jgi:hypothetical protein